MQDDNTRSNFKGYAANPAGVDPAAGFSGGNVVPTQTFNSGDGSVSPASQVVAPEDMLKKVGAQEEYLEGNLAYNEEAAIKQRSKLFGRSIVQVFAIAAILVLLIIGVGPP